MTVIVFYLLSGSGWQVAVTVFLQKLQLTVKMVEREECLDSPVAPAGSWIKHWLSCHFRSQLSLEDDVQSDRWSSHPFCTKKGLVVALLVILALVVMVMLLLLNYYCIMVWKMCYQEETVALPEFGSTSGIQPKQ